MDFAKKRKPRFTANVASAHDGGSIHLHLDRADGPEIGVLPVSSTGGSDRWQTVTTLVSPATGIHDLYFVFEGSGGGELFSFDSWKFQGR